MLLHSYGYDSRMWHRLGALLGQDFTVIVLDRPGHGRNIDELRVRRVDARSIEEYAELYTELRDGDNEVDEVEALLERLAHPTLSLVGFGDGGVLALHLAARGRVHVDAAVLINSPVRVPRDLTVEEILDRLEERGFDGPSHVELVARFLETKDPGPWVDWMMSQDDLSAVPVDDYELLRSMLLENAVSAMFTTSGLGPGSLAEDQLAAVSNRVLALRVGAQPQRWGEPIKELLPHAEASQLDILDGPACYPLTRAADCFQRIEEFLNH